MPGPLLNKLKAIRRRLRLIEFCRKFLTILTWASLALLSFVIVSRLVLLSVAPLEVLPWCGGVALVLLLGWNLFGRIRLLDAAIRADQSLGLKERLSSAFLIGEPRSEAETAVLEDAARHAQSIRPRRQFPFQLQREMKWTAFPLAALILVWWLMPQFNLLAKREEKRQADALKVEIKKETAKELETLAKEVAKTGELGKSEIAPKVEHELSELAKKINDKSIQPEQAMAKLAKLSDKIAQGKAEIEKKLSEASRLQSMGKGKMTKEISKAMEKGNFQKAAEALEELKKKMQKGELSKEEQSALQKELKAMAEKLGKDSKLGEAMSKAADKMGDGNSQEASADLEQAASEMMDMQQMMAEMKALDSLKYDLDAHNKALSGKSGKCKNCGADTEGEGMLCDKCEEQFKGWKTGNSRNQGSGGGKSGIGKGGIANKTEGPTAFDKTRIKGDLQPGKIIGKMKIDGEQNPGQATVQYEQLRMEYAQKAEDTVHNEMMPMEYKSLVRNYFDAIKSGKEEQAGKDHSTNQTEKDRAQEAPDSKVTKP